MKKSIVVFILMLGVVTNGICFQYEKIFKNKKILITGGTGFLGRMLIKRILDYEPNKIYVFSRDEVKQYKILEEFQTDKVESFLGDVRDLEILTRATEGVDIVIHCAALKRVDTLEYFPLESVKTNILGSLNIIKACKKNKVKKSVFISTDKACSPVNVYGASKFISERLFAQENGSGISFVIVRYGNVLESTGSVIPFFKKCINENKDIPITDPNMTRFIISKENAVEVIFKALLYGENGEIFVPKIFAFKIMDLVEVLKEVYNSQVKSVVVGARPGEKIYEQLINETEISRSIDHDDVFIISPLIKGSSNSTKCSKFSKNLFGSRGFSSDLFVISKDELKKILNDNGIISLT